MKYPCSRIFSSSKATCYTKGAHRKGRTIRVARTLMSLKKSSNTTGPCDRLLQEPITFPRKISRTFHETYQSNTVIDNTEPGITKGNYCVHSVLTTCIMNRKLPMRNSKSYENIQRYTYFCSKIVCFSLLWWNKSPIPLIFGKKLIISIVSTYSCPKLEQINHFKWLLNFICIKFFRNQGRNNDYVGQ